MDVIRIDLLPIEFFYFEIWWIYANFTV